MSRSTRQQQSANRRSNHRNVVLALAIGAALLIFAVIAWPTDHNEQHGAVSAPDAFAHVHGLGVDPADGMLYAGTHYGAFRVPEGAKPVQVGPTRDYMGFTVVGPKRFLASGHPGIGEDAPGNLGLIESTDGGQSWQTLSLRGRADFHVLTSRHGTTYGYSGGVLMVSRDSVTWEERSSTPLRHFAVSAKNVDRLLAITRDGLAISEDGGRTYTPIAAAPPLVLVAVADDDTSVGVSADGTVYASVDDGITWERRGSVGGAPQAITVTTGTVHVATGGAILDSADGGQTFTTRLSIGG